MPPGRTPLRSSAEGRTALLSSAHPRKSSFRRPHGRHRSHPTASWPPARISGGSVEYPAIASGLSRFGHYCPICSIESIPYQYPPYQVRVNPPAIVFSMTIYPISESCGSSKLKVYAKGIPFFRSSLSCSHSSSYLLTYR